MHKQDVLKRFNEIILDEKGCKVTMNSLFTDAELDSLGTTIVLITIDSEFHIFNMDVPGQDIADLDFKTLTIRDLVIKCVLSITTTSTVQKIEPTI